MKLLNDPLILTGVALLSIAMGKTAMIVVGAVCIVLAILTPL